MCLTKHTQRANTLSLNHPRPIPHHPRLAQTKRYQRTGLVTALLGLGLAIIFIITLESRWWRILPGIYLAVGIAFVIQARTHVGFVEVACMRETKAEVGGVAPALRSHTYAPYFSTTNTTGASNTITARGARRAVPRDPEQGPGADQPGGTKGLWRGGRHRRRPHCNPRRAA